MYENNITYYNNSTFMYAENNAEVEMPEKYTMLINVKFLFSLCLCEKWLSGLMVQNAFQTGWRWFHFGATSNKPFVTTHSKQTNKRVIHQKFNIFS